MTAQKHIAGAAILLSVSVHIALAAMWSKPASVAPQGGAVSGQVALGNGFADLVQGVHSGALDRLDEVAETVPPVTQTVQPTPAITQFVQPAQARSAPVVAQTNQSARATAVAAKEAVSSKSPLEIAEQPVPPVVKAQDPSPDPAVRALQAFKPKPRPERVPTPLAKSAPRGDASVNAATGHADGVAKAKVAQSNNAPKTKAKQAGETQLRSYQSNVRRRVARTKTRAAGGSGSVRLSLTISAGGALVSTRIVQSSGNARADKAALESVRRAAPFGPTPTQKAVVFQIQIDVKG